MLGLREALVKSVVPADRFLKPLVVLLIVLWCGPEVFAVIELTTLLELLGATLFLLAFAASFKLLALSMLGWLRRVLVPDEFAALIRTRLWPYALAGMLTYGVVLFIIVLTPYVVLSALLRGA